MIEILSAHIIQKLGKDVGNLDLVLNQFKHISVERNKFLVQQGETCNHVYFIAKGCLQVFVYDSEMNETTRDIVTEGTWCSELLSFGSGKPANENIRTVEPCELLAIDRKGFQKMIETVPEFDKF